MTTWTEKCPTCAGTGRVLKDATACNRSPTPNELKDCPNCNGNGIVTMWEVKDGEQCK